MDGTASKRPPHRSSRSTVNTEGTPADARAWAPPVDLEDGFRTRIGASVVEEFVAGHTATDVLRELVQKELARFV